MHLGRVAVLNRVTGEDLEEVRQPRGHREEAVPGSRMESRQDRKLWGHEQGRLTWS